jgi:uncharacterized membrane protein YfcA
MPIDLIVLAALALMAAGVVKGVTGIGYSTSALPLLALTVGLKTGMPLVLLPSITSNVMVMRTAGDFAGTLRRFWPIYLAVLPGLVVGLAILPHIADIEAGGVLGLVLGVYAAAMLLRGPWLMPQGWSRPLMVPVGLLTGLVNGLTGSQVMPLVPYLLSLGLPANAFVQASNISFTLSSLVMLVGLARVGLLGWTELGLTITGIAPALAGVAIGNAIRQRLAAETLRRLVLGALLVMGLALVVKAVG